MVNFRRERQAGKALLGVLLALALILIGLPRLCLADAGVEDRLAVCARELKKMPRACEVLRWLAGRKTGAFRRAGGKTIRAA